MVEAPQYTATEAKHKFGQLLDSALRTGPVAIIKQRKPAAVLISLDQYRALTQAEDRALAALSAEFDRQFSQMQAPGGGRRHAAGVRYASSAARRFRGCLSADETGSAAKPRQRSGRGPSVVRQKVAAAVAKAQIFVLAGCNGAGKSSLGGQAFLAAGIPYFNPDLAAREAISIASARGRPMTQGEANAWAWNEGVARLRRAIAERGNYALETTLGGDTIVGLLMEAADAGLGVNVWFVGLDSVELHVARVRQRVARGGHDIPRADIERRYIRGRVNLIRLLPRLSQLAVYDNSAQADPDAPTKVAPRLLLRSVGGAIIGPSDLSQTPAWAKPVIAAALKLDRSRRRALGEPD